MMTMSHQIESIIKNIEIENGLDGISGVEKHNNWHEKRTRWVQLANVSWQRKYKKRMRKPFDW